MSREQTQATILVLTGCSATSLSNCAKIRLHNSVKYVFVLVANVRLLTVDNQ